MSGTPLTPKFRVRAWNRPGPEHCSSFTSYAQHYKKDAPGGDFYLMRGSYDNHAVRTQQGWRITRVIRHISWVEGNADALTEALAPLLQ